MPRIYRAMLPDGPSPQVGPDVKMLGVRTPADAKPGSNLDIAPDAHGNVHPRTGGMSVAPALASLPKHRIPRRFRVRGVPQAEGTDRLSVWSLGEGPFVEGPLLDGLYLRIDPKNPVHGLVEPDRS